MLNSLKTSSTKSDLFVENQSQRDSKYTVAEILSSMTNGVSTNYSGVEQTPSTSHPITSAIQTPILTPTTLANIERDFIELTRTATSGIDNSFMVDPSCMPQDLSLSTGQRESGFVPPVVELPIGSASMAVKREYTDDSSSDCSSNATGPPSAKRQRRLKVPVINPDTYLVANSRRPTGPRKLKHDDNLSAEDEEKKKLRKDRNKVAAAKCRQRRVDQTNELINETEQLEEEKANLENEIQSLTQQREQLEFYLQAHNRVCGHANSPLTVQVKTEKQSSTEAPTCSSNLMFRSSSASARPNSLPLSMSGGRAFGVISTSNNISSVTGIPITTPSSGLALLNFGLDHLAEGHTGLTPLTGVPVSLMGATPTSTPTNCSGAAHQKHSDSSSPENLSSPKLMAIL